MTRRWRFLAIGTVAMLLADSMVVAGPGPTRPYSSQPWDEPRHVQEDLLGGISDEADARYEDTRRYSDEEYDHEYHDGRAHYDGNYTYPDDHHQGDEWEEFNPGAIELAAYREGFLPPVGDVPLVGAPLCRLSQTVSGCGGGCCSDGCAPCCDCCACRWWGLTGFAGVDGWRGRLDGGGASNFGPRVGANLGLVLFGDLGAQVGASYAGYDMHGRGGPRANNRPEEQLFVTAGVFRRLSCLGCNSWLDRLTWGVVWDHMIAKHLGAGGENADLSQIRFRVGLLLDYCNELGVWAAGDLGSHAMSGTNNRSFRTRAIDQINIYWRHKYCYGGEVTFWGGLADDPGEVTIGGMGELPLNDYLALYGNFHYILPSTSGGVGTTNPMAFNEEYWNVTVGINIYFGGCACRKSLLDHRWMPMLPVADNGSFALE